MELKITIDDAALRRRLALVTSGATMRELNRSVGRGVLERVKDHLDKMAASRHKTADRLGAPHSRFYEYASGRVGGSPRGQTTELESFDESGSTIAIKNTPGLSRAFHDITIRPRRAKALTIPLSRISYNKRVADLERDGHEIFRPKGKNILAERKGDDGMRPLYALVKSVTIPKDEGLMPTKGEVREWAAEFAAAFFALKMKRG